MLKIGRYRIAFGRYLWFQTRVPTTVRRFLCFWLFKEARPQDVDREQQFPIDTVMERDGRHYRYFKAVKAMRKGEVVTKEKRKRLIAVKREGG